MDDEKEKFENTDLDYDRGMERGLEGRGVSDPIIDTRSDQQKEAERRGNEAGKAIRAGKQGENDSE